MNRPVEVARLEDIKALYQSYCIHLAKTKDKALLPYLRGHKDGLEEALVMLGLATSIIMDRLEQEALNELSNHPR